MSEDETPVHICGSMLNEVVLVKDPARGEARKRGGGGSGVGNGLTLKYGSSIRLEMLVSKSPSCLRGTGSSNPFGKGVS